MGIEEGWKGVGLPSASDIRQVTDLCNKQAQEIETLKAETENLKSVVGILLTHLDDFSSRYDVGRNGDVQTMLNGMETMRQSLESGMNAGVAQIKTDILAQFNASTETAEASRKAHSESILNAIRETSQAIHTDTAEQSDADRKELVKQLDRLTQHLDERSTADKKSTNAELERLYQLLHLSSNSQEELLRLLVINSVRDEVETMLKQ